ncbi:hypothetical protein L1049_014124 [Liquidambar formosana]|uniref:Protein FAR1-RELATED SEQUENCE n=1 Tax=Liquidambar formosana TaxID=63359 RepID=A0AAP0WUN9_LIQFO
MTTISPEIEEASSSKEGTCDENEVNDNNLDVSEKKLEPKVRMTFSFQKEVNEYYKNYARQEGFGVLKRTISWDDDGNIRASVQKDGKFRLNTVKIEHNHTLSPGKTRYFRYNKRLDPRVKRRLEINDEAGIGLSKNFHSFVVERDGYDNLTFGEKDAQNHIEKARRLRFGVGDAEAIQQYFSRMQERNAQFYYMMDFGENCHIKNVFWADARSRATYEAFGDVITFDTIYLTNKYRMPFAPFVGNVVYDSYTEVEFEEGWKLMIDRYDLHDNEWLDGLYGERHRWVPKEGSICTYKVDEQIKISEGLKYVNFSIYFNEVESDVKCTYSKEKCNDVMSTLGELENRVLSDGYICGSSPAPQVATDEEVIGLEENNTSIASKKVLSLLAVRTKGRSPN